MSNYLWGLDLSLTCTGLTVYDLDKKEFVFIGSFNTEKIRLKKAQKDLGIYLNGIKLKHLYDWLMEIKISYPPTIIAIERGLSRFNTATQVIYRVHGLTNFIFHDLPQFYYPPKEVKAAIYKGDATKAQVQKVIMNNFIHLDIEFKNEDESDSFAVALTYLIKNGLIEFEKPVVDKPKPKRKTKSE